MKNNTQIIEDLEIKIKNFQTEIDNETRLLTQTNTSIKLNKIRQRIKNHKVKLKDLELKLDYHKKLEPPKKTVDT